MQNIYDIAVIGGGPSGMMAAITAAKKSSVVLIEKNESLGKKILVTGNGRCNLTNRFINKDRYHGGNQEFIDYVLKTFDQSAVMKFFESLGVVLKEEDNGRIFPRTNQAQTIVNALIDQLQDRKVILKTKASVKKISKDSDIFDIVLSDGNNIKAQKVILAVGGQSHPQLGTTGDGYYWAELFGHTITDTSPALVPLETVEDWPKELTGLRVEGKSYVTCNDKIISEKTGDILFTHFGLSAPSVMAHAGRFKPYLNQKLYIHLDLFPDQTAKELDGLFMQMFEATGKKTLKNTLTGLIPSNLVPVVLSQLNIQDKKTAEVGKNDRLKIAEFLKDIKLEIKQTRSFKESQVTSGGVNLDEIEMKTLQSKITKGLYFAGEVLDVDGDSGGFNLQWAWSSGSLAGETLD